MPKRDIELYLQDIEESANAIHVYLAYIDFETFCND